MKLIVGLGNPGEKYQRTRHNIGFLVVEQFLKDFEPAAKTVWENSENLKSDIVELEWQPRHGKAERVILVKPKTYMNNSGMAVQLLIANYRLPTANLWVVYDDVDLPLGAMRIRFGGASAGHKGVDSIMRRLQTHKFWRFRMGIGGQKQRLNSKNQKVRDIDNYVLGKFTGAQWGKARELIKRGSKAIEGCLEEGLERAMSRFNTR